MKKLSCLIISLLLLFVLVSCNNDKAAETPNGDETKTESNTTGSIDTDEKKPISTETQDTSDNSDRPENTEAATTTAKDSSTSALPKETETVAKDNTSTPPKATETTSVTPTPTPPKATETTANNNPPAPPKETETTSKENNTTPPQNNDSSVSLKDIDNGVLKKASPETMVIPENIKSIETSTATKENASKTIKATVVAYCLDGEVVNWTTENDFIYAITSGNNRLVIINSNKMAPVANAPLAGVPAEMNIVGDKIYISFPDLYRIDIFSKADCKKEGSLYFDHEVSSFCLDGDYIYYSEHDQFCRVFKKNLKTNELEIVPSKVHNTFYQPKIYLNKEDRILYIGETNYSGCTLYYHDADTLELKSEFKKNDYGFNNNTREIFHVGDEIFWGNYRFSDTNAKEIIGKYGTHSYGSLVYASEELVSTREGLFLTDTYECIIDYFYSDFKFEYILLTDSYNIFFRNDFPDGNIIIGVNFDIQEIDTI